MNSQEELAEKIGVSRQTLSKYETGETLPDIEKCKARQIFEISPGDSMIVLGDEGQDIWCWKGTNGMQLAGISEKECQMGSITN